jgi:hypothetical protein
MCSPAHCSHAPAKKLASALLQKRTGDAVEYESRVVSLHTLRSYYEIGDQKYHVHQELVKATHSGHFVQLCEKCAVAAVPKSKKSTPKAPRDSLAAGLDFGLFSRLNVDQPTAMEVLALAKVRIYSLTAKVRVPGVNEQQHDRRQLCGHLISFMHDGPSKVADFLDAARVNEILLDFELVFVGPEGRRGTLERKALEIPDLQLRLHVICSFLNIKDGLEAARQQPVHQTLEQRASFNTSQATKAGQVFEKTRALLQQLDQRRSVPSAGGGCTRWISSEEVIAVDDAVKPSDFGNVRDVAWSKEHADIEGADQPRSDFRLDPLGVLCGADGQALTQLFDSVIEMVNQTGPSGDSDDSDEEGNDAGDFDARAGGVHDRDDDGDHVSHESDIEMPDDDAAPMSTSASSVEAQPPSTSAAPNEQVAVGYIECSTLSPTHVLTTVRALPAQPPSYDDDDAAPMSTSASSVEAQPPSTSAAPNEQVAVG